MSRFSADSPFATPQIAEQPKQERVAQQPQQQTFQPAWDEQTTRFHANMYRKNPAGYDEAKLNTIREHAGYHGVPFYEGDFSILSAINQAGAGFVEGFTTLSIADHPDNEYESVVRNLGHLVGFVPGILSKPLNLIKAKGLAKKLGGLKSIPMLGADAIQKQAKKIIAPSLEAARASRYGAVKSASDFLLGNRTKHILEGAFHLGTASSISSWQQGVDGMMDAFVGGAAAGGVFRSIGNFIKLGNPKGETAVKAIAGSLFMGLPSTARGATTPEQIYEYVMGAYFGGMEGPWTRKASMDYLKKMEKRAQTEPEKYGSFDPEILPEWTKTPKPVQKLVKQYAESGIPGTDFKGYGSPELRRGMQYMLANRAGALKGITDKGEAIIDMPGFELTRTIKEGERVFKLKPETYKKWEKYGVSGLSEGSDAVWASIASKYGMPMVQYTTKAYQKAQKKKGIKPEGFQNVLTDAELQEANIKIQEANVSLNRKLSGLKKYYLDLIKNNWFQVKHSNEVFAVGELEADMKTVKGGTGWGVQMGVDKGIPVNVLNTSNNKWYAFKPGINKFGPIKSPTDMPSRSTFIGSRNIPKLPNFPSIRKSMESLFSSQFKPLPAKIPPIEARQPIDIKVLKTAQNKLKKDISESAKQFNALSKRIKESDDINVIDALKEQQSEIRNELKSQKAELNKLEKAELEKYTEKGDMIESTESVTESQDIDNIPASNTQLGDRALRFVNRHLKDVWSSDKFPTPELQSIEQLRLGKILSDKLVDYIDKGSLSNRSGEWVKSVQKELGDDIVLSDNARREMRNWITQRNQNVPVQHYGYDGNKLYKLNEINPYTRAGNRKQQMEPLKEIDRVYQKYGRKGRAYGVLDHVTTYDADGRAVDVRLSNYRTYKSKNWPAELKRIIDSLNDKDMYVFGGKGDADRLMIAKYHPLMKSISTTDASRIRSLFGKDYVLSAELSKKVYGLDKKRHDAIYFSNVLYDMEMNGLELAGIKMLGGKLNDLAKMGKGSFIRNSKAFNKRSQIWNTNGYSADPKFAQKNIKDLSQNGNYKFIIAEDLPKDLKVDFADIKTKNTQLPEGVDGAIITRTDVLNTINADAGMPKESGNNKSFIVSPNSQFGALLGKYMMHDAGPSLSKQMEAKGLHYIMMESAVKQKGFRKSGDYEMGANGELIVNAPTYELPAEHIKYNFSVISGNEMTHPQNLPKQVLSNLLTTNWNKTDKRIIDDMVNTLMGEKFNGQEVWNTELSRYLELPEGPEKSKSLNNIVKNIDKIGMLELLDAMKTNGNEKLTNAIYGTMMKLSRNWLERATAEGELTQAQKDVAVAELNESFSVADNMLKLSPNAPILLHKFVNKYRQTVLQNYIVQSVTKPKVENSIVARMRPYDKWLRKTLPELKGTNDEIFYLDDGFRNTVIQHNIKGIKARTLGELWDMRKELEATNKSKDETSNFDKIINALAVRVPMDSMSGAHKLKFGGFTGRQGHGVLLHGRTMRALGGADLDGDEAFVFFGGKNGFKESWKDAYHKNKKEYYVTDSKGKTTVRDNKTDVIPSSVKKVLGIPASVKTYRDLLTINNIKVGDKTLPIESTQSLGMMYSPYERIRISEAAVDGRNMLGMSAVNPKQIMQSSVAAVLAKSENAGKDSWQFTQNKKDKTITVEARTEKDMQAYQRQLMRAMVGFASDPLDEAGLKTSDAWFRLLFNAHYKIKTIDGKTPTPYETKKLPISALKGNTEGLNKSMYAKFYNMNAAYFGRNWIANRKFNMAEIKERSSQVETLEPEQINSFIPKVAELLNNADWSDNLSGRISRDKVNKVYNNLKKNLKNYDELKEVMGRSSFAVPMGRNIDNVLKYKLWDAKVMSKFAKNPKLFKVALDGTMLKITSKEARNMTLSERLNKLEQLKHISNDYLVNDMTDMISIDLISKLYKNMNAKERANIPKIFKKVEDLKLNSYLMARERAQVNSKIIEEALKSRSPKESIQELNNTLIEQGDFLAKRPSAIARGEKVSAKLDQFQIDKAITSFKEGLNKKEQKMFDMMMLGSQKRGDLGKIDAFIKKFEKLWDGTTLGLLKKLRYKASSTGMSQLGFASKSIENASKKEFLDSYNTILKESWKGSPDANIKKEVEAVKKLNTEAFEPEYPDFVAEANMPETGLEGITRGKLSQPEKSLIAEIVTNLKSYNNKVGQNIAEITRGIVGKNLNAMNRQDFEVLNNYFKEIKRGTFFQAFSKNDLQKLQKRHWWLFPKAVNKELMKYDMKLMKEKGFFFDRYGKGWTGTVQRPTHYIDILQTWIHRMNNQADAKSEEYIKDLQNRLLFVNSIPEGETLRQGAIYKRQLPIAERILNDKSATKANKISAAGYRKDYKEWLSKNQELLNQEFTITLDGKRVKKSGEEILRRINTEYTSFFKDMLTFIKGTPGSLAPFNLSKPTEAYPRFDSKAFINHLQGAWSKGKDVSAQYGIDGLRFIARSMMVDLAKGTKNKEFIQALKENKLDPTGDLGSDVYWPRMFIDKKQADKAMLNAYKAIKNTPNSEMSKEEKAIELKKIIYKHKKLTGDWNFQDVEEWDLYDTAIKEIAEKKSLGTEKIRWFSENQRAGSMFKRSMHIPGYSVDATVPEAYTRSLVNTYFRQLSNIFSRDIINEVTNPKKSFAKKFGKDQAQAWSNFMKLYVQDALGNPTVIPKEMYEDPKMQLKGTPYAAWADNRVLDRMNKAMIKLGIDKKDLPTELKGITLQQLRNWSNLEGQYEMASLLAHPKSMITNIFGGTLHTIQSASLANLKDARNVEWLRSNINNKWNSMRDIDEFVIKQGVLPEFLLAEFGVQKELQQQRNIDFIKDVAKKVTRDPEISKQTLNEIQKKYNVKDRVVQFAAKFMSVPERKIRRDAFMAHYVQAWKRFGGAITNPEHPMLIEMAKKGVKATQFLYSAPFRPAFARTALGKVLTRFQLWSWNSVRFRNDVNRQARIYGYRPGTEAYERYKRTKQLDLFMFAMANVFMYSIFETALPAPWNWYQDTADWLLGDENERNKAFYGAWPTQVAPLQMITPPVLRMLPATARALVDDDWSKLSQYYMWTMFPFGRMARDIVGPGNIIQNPIRTIEKTTGLPVMQAQRFMGKEQEVAPPTPSIFD